MSAIIDQLRQLAEMLKDGLLTREEFDEQKRILLARGQSDGPAAIPTPGLPTRVGAYKVLALAGQGGMGHVYRARHRTQAVAVRQGGDVAIKALLPSLASDPRFRRRFEREAGIGLKLDHPGIVKVYDLIIDAGTLAIVMEWVEGRELSSVIGRETGPMPWRRALGIYEGLLEAVGYAHEFGVVHRDIKPENLVLLKDDAIKVLDFGIAKSSDHQATRTGSGLGTIAYMAPEQYRNAKEIDVRADIYALGMTLYEMLAGRLPWDDEATDVAILMQKLQGELPLPTDFYPHIPSELVGALFRALARDPDERYDSAADFAEALGEVAVETTGRLRRPTPPPAADRSDASSRQAVQERQRVEQEEQRRQEEEQRRQEEEQGRQEEEQRRAEEDRKQAEEERLRADAERRRAEQEAADAALRAARSRAAAALSTASAAAADLSERLQSGRARADSEGGSAESVAAALAEAEEAARASVVACEDVERAKTATDSATEPHEAIAEAEQAETAAAQVAEHAVVTAARLEHLERLLLLRPLQQSALQLAGAAQRDADEAEQAHREARAAARGCSGADVKASRRALRLCAEEVAEQAARAEESAVGLSLTDDPSTAEAHLVATRTAAEAAETARRACEVAARELVRSAHAEREDQAKAAELEGQRNAAWEQASAEVAAAEDAVAGPSDRTTALRTRLASPPDLTEQERSAWAVVEEANWNATEAANSAATEAAATRATDDLAEVTAALDRCRSTARTAVDCARQWAQALDVVEALLAMRGPRQGARHVAAGANEAAHRVAELLGSIDLEATGREPERLRRELRTLAQTAATRAGEAQDALHRVEEARDSTELETACEGVASAARLAAESAARAPDVVRELDAAVASAREEARRTERARQEAADQARREDELRREQVEERRRAAEEERRVAAAAEEDAELVRAERDQTLVNDARGQAAELLDECQDITKKVVSTRRAATALATGREGSEIRDAVASIAAAADACQAAVQRLRDAVERCNAATEPIEAAAQVDRAEEAAAEAREQRDASRAALTEVSRLLALEAPSGDSGPDPVSPSVTSPAEPPTKDEDNLEELDLEPGAPPIHLARDSVELILAAPVLSARTTTEAEFEGDAGDAGDAAAKRRLLFWLVAAALPLLFLGLVGALTVGRGSSDAAPAGVATRIEPSGSEGPAPGSGATTVPSRSDNASTPEPVRSPTAETTPGRAETPAPTPEPSRAPATPAPRPEPVTPTQLLAAPSAREDVAAVRSPSPTPTAPPETTPEAIPVLQPRLRANSSPSVVGGETIHIDIALDPIPSGISCDVTLMYQTGLDPKGTPVSETAPGRYRASISTSYGLAYTVSWWAAADCEGQVVRARGAVEVLNL